MEKTKKVKQRPYKVNCNGTCTVAATSEQAEQIAQYYKEKFKTGTITIYKIVKQYKRTKENA